MVGYLKQPDVPRLARRTSSCWTHEGGTELPFEKFSELLDTLVLPLYAMRTDNASTLLVLFCRLLAFRLTYHAEDILIKGRLPGIPRSRGGGRGTGLFQEDLYG